MGVGGEVLICPYSLKVQVCPLRDQRPAVRSRVSGAGFLFRIEGRDLLYAPSHRQNRSRC